MTTDRLLRLCEVAHVSGMGKSAIYEMIKIGEFPEPVRVGLRAVRWRESEVQHWISTRPSTSGKR